MSGEHSTGPTLGDLTADLMVDAVPTSPPAPAAPPPATQVADGRDAAIAIVSAMVPQAVPEAVEAEPEVVIEAIEDADIIEDADVAGPASAVPGIGYAGTYELVARFPGSDMMEVFLAHKTTRFGFVRTAVVKRANPSRGDFETCREMLLDEARAIAWLAHENIVSILDVGEDEMGFFIAMEHVDGTDLRRVNALLRRRGEALPFELACYIAESVLRGLHSAHGAHDPDGVPLSIVHRDVNPSNVLISTTGHVKLTDFGVVHMRDRLQGKTKPGIVKGKYAYLAPEYILGKPCDFRVDVYGVGIMLFEMLTGRPCFSGLSAHDVMRKIVREELPLERLEREGVPRDLEAIVIRATHGNPSRRFASAEEMANALETWIMRSGQHATPWILSAFFRQHQLFESSAQPARLPRASAPAAAVERPTVAPPAGGDPAPAPAPTHDAAGEPPAAAASQLAGRVAPFGRSMDDLAAATATPAPAAGRAPEEDGRAAGQVASLAAPFGRAWKDSDGAPPAAGAGDDLDAIPTAPAVSARASQLAELAADAGAPAATAAPFGRAAAAGEPAGAAARASQLAAPFGRAIAPAPSAEPEPAQESDLSLLPPPLPRTSRPSLTPPAEMPVMPAVSLTTAPPSGGMPAARPREEAQTTPGPAADEMAALSKAAARALSAATAGLAPPPDTLRSGGMPAPSGPRPRASLPPPEARVGMVLDDPAELAPPPSRMEPEVLTAPGLPPVPPGALPPLEPEVQALPADDLDDDMPLVAPVPLDADAIESVQDAEPDELDTLPPVALDPALMTRLDEGARPAPSLPPEPVGPWSGAIEEHSTGQVLTELTRRRASGAVEFRNGPIWKRLTLLGGRPCELTSNVGMEDLSEQLLRAKVLSRDELNRLHREGGAGDLLSRLLARGNVDRAALASQLGRTIENALAEVLDWHAGRFEFFPGDPPAPALMPAIDLATYVAVRRPSSSARSQAPSGAPAPADGGTAAPRPSLSDALKMARKMARGTGKGRVDAVNRDD